MSKWVNFSCKSSDIRFRVERSGSIRNSKPTSEGGGVREKMMRVELYDYEESSVGGMGGSSYCRASPTMVYRNIINNVKKANSSEDTSRRRRAETATSVSRTSHAVL